MRPYTPPRIHPFKPRCATCARLYRCPLPNVLALGLLTPHGFSLTLLSYKDRALAMASWKRTVHLPPSQPSLLLTPNGVAQRTQGGWSPCKNPCGSWSWLNRINLDTEKSKLLGESNQLSFSFFFTFFKVFSVKYLTEKR